MDKIPCVRCDGTGEIPAFRHVKSGVCFRCWGTGHDLRAERQALEACLKAARVEYRKLSLSLKSAKGEQRTMAAAALAALTRHGKRLAQRLVLQNNEMRALMERQQNALN